MEIKFNYGSEKDFCKNYGVKLSNEEIQRMIDECVGRLNKDNWQTFQGSGDTMVFVFGFRDDYDEGNMSEINVFVCKNYEEAEAWKEESGSWKKMDWSIDYEAEEAREEYEKYSREELIEMLMRERRPEYNPLKEV